MIPSFFQDAQKPFNTLWTNISDFASEQWGTEFAYSNWWSPEIPVYAEPVLALSKHRGKTAWCDVIPAPCPFHPQPRALCVSKGRKHNVHSTRQSRTACSQNTKDRISDFFFFGSIIVLSCIMDAQAGFGLLKTKSKALLYSCKSHGLQIEAFSSVSSTMLSNEIAWLQ